jgi:hypothetical protein
MLLAITALGANKRGAEPPREIIAGENAYFFRPLRVSGYGDF